MKRNRRNHSQLVHRLKDAGVTGRNIQNFIFYGESIKSSLATEK